MYDFDLGRQVSNVNGSLTLSSGVSPDSIRFPSETNWPSSNLVLIVAPLPFSIRDAHVLQLQPGLGLIDCGSCTKETNDEKSESSLFHAFVCVCGLFVLLVVCFFFVCCFFVFFFVLLVFLLPIFVTI